MELRLNKYQTNVDDNLKKSLPKEVWEQLLDSITNIQFIKHLISPEDVRGYASDLEVMQIKKGVDKFGNDIFSEDVNGRKKIDITKPHILEDMDFFRERAIFFNKTGKYTNIQINPNPKSDYGLFWKKELTRWKYGLVRPSDGEWIPGSLYFYWNYVTIWRSRKDKLTGKSERVSDFPLPWLGDYLFFHYLDQAESAGSHAKMLKSRGVGASFKMASLSPRNMYIKPGSGNPNFHLASDKSFLTGDQGIFGKVIDNLDWIAKNTPFPKIRIQDSKRAMSIQLGYTDSYGVRKGLLSSVHGISLKDNPDKSRGLRGPFIHYEEDGLFKELEKAWNVNRHAVEDGGVTVGLMVAAGTGGTENADFEASEKLFYYPNGYNIYGIPNVFDKNTDGSNKCGFFWGSYLSRKGCYENPNGEPDVIKALVEVLLDRYKVKYEAKDGLALAQKKAEEPITPQDAVMRVDGTIFPIADLKEHLETIKINEKEFVSRHYVGELVYDSLANGVKWKINDNITPLRSYSNTKGDLSGAVEIFEMPRRDANNFVIKNRYIGGIDTIDADAGKSLFSILILDTFTDRIVAEYTGRSRRASESYEIALKLLIFYSAKANYEKNLKGLFSYFKNKNKLHYLAETPQILRDMDIVKSIGYGNNAYGTHATTRINSWGRELQADWMSSPILGFGGDDDKNILNLHKLRSIAYIEEALAWNKDGNFDRISAGGMLFIYREEMMRRTNYMRKQKSDHIVSLSNDKFFNRNYKKRF